MKAVSLRILLILHIHARVSSSLLQLFATVILLSSEDYINLSKFKSRPCKQNEKWSKCKNSLIVSFHLTYKINMDFIQRCIVIFKRLLILEVILLSLVGDF